MSLRIAAVRDRPERVNGSRRRRHRMRCRAIPELQNGVTASADGSVAEGQTWVANYLEDLQAFIPAMRRITTTKEQRCMIVVQAP